MTQNIIRSKFLIHWTGKDKYSSQEYIELLEGICKKGLFMNQGKRKKMQGKNNSWIKRDIARTCFTEIKLSQVKKHAEKYGYLGIGFHRNFVLEREGNPVFYTQNSDKSHIIQNLSFIYGRIKDKKEQLKALEIILGYLKPMSEFNKNDNLEYYDEMEWRIVRTDEILKGGYITEYEKGKYSIKIKAEDIKIIIFPDQETQKLFLKNQYLATFFKSHSPIMVLLDDCKNF